MLHTQAQKAADEARARAQMEAALGAGGGGGGDGASWGLMGPDAEWEEGAGPSGEGLDWRLHMEKQTLTDKQMKLVDKIRWVGFIQAGLLGSGRVFGFSKGYWVQGGFLGSGRGFELR